MYFPLSLQPYDMMCKLHVFNKWSVLSGAIIISGSTITSLRVTLNTAQSATAKLTTAVNIAISTNRGMGGTFQCTYFNTSLYSHKHRLEVLQI